MKDNELKNIISTMEKQYDISHSFVLTKDLAHFQNIETTLKLNEKLFFIASRSRILLTHWVVEKVREIFEKASFEPIDISNEVYEKLRKEFNSKTFNKEKLVNLFCHNKKSILSYEDFLKIESNIIDEYNAVVSNDMQLSKINHIFVIKKDETNDFKQELKQFMKNNRQEELISYRAEGLTLDEVGIKFNITRERARQIEIKPKSLIERWLEDKHQLLIEKFSNNNVIIDAEKAKKYFGNKYWQIIKYIVSSSKNNISNWYYVKELDTIIYSKNNQLYKDIIDCIQVSCDSEKTIDTVVDNIQKKYEFVTKELLVTFIKNSNYKLFGNKLFKSKLSIGESILIAAETDFNNGVNIGNKDELTRFSNYLNDTFELNVQPNRALTARIQDVLIMSDDAIYKSPKFILSTKELDKAIKDNMNKLADDRTTYHNLYSLLPEKLLNKHGIENQSGLHGYIKKHEEELNLIALRYYVCKKNTTELLSKGFFVKLPNWLLEMNKPVTLDEILKAFPDWTDMYPKYAMIYFPEIVQWDKQTYYNIKCISIPDDILKKLKKLVNELTNNKLGYTNIYIIYKKAKILFNDFLTKNNIDNENKLYQLLKFSLADDSIIFTKPHILKGRNDITDYSTENLIYEVIGEKDVISKSWLKTTVYSYYGERNSSLSLAFHKVLKNYIRLDSDRYIKNNKIKLSDKDVEKVIKLIKENMKDGKYLIPSKISFDNFPKTSQNWNSWLLCEVIKKYNMPFEVLNKKKNILFNTMILSIKMIIH